jgi:hypothetical protein
MKMSRVNVLALCASLLVFACGDDETVDPSTAAPKVHATASILRVNDAVGEKVVAQLILILETDTGAEFVENAADVVVRFGGQEVFLPAQLVQLRGEGANGLQTHFYRVDSQSKPELVYTAGTEYTFIFTAPGPDGKPFDATTHTMTIAAPSVENSVAEASTPERDKQLDVVTPDGFDSGILEVVMASSGETTYASYPYSEQHLASAQQVLDSAGSLAGYGGGILTVPPEAFSRQGTHAVKYIGLNVKTGVGSGVGLGEFSSVFAGAAAEAAVNIP